MSHSYDHAVCLRKLLKFRKLHPILPLCHIRIRPAIRHDRIDIKFFQMVYDVNYLAVPRIRAILLKGDTQNHHSCFFRGHLLDSGIRHKSSHTVVNFASIENDLAVIPQFLCCIGQIIGIHANAVAAHKARTESQRIPLRIHTCQDLICIDLHLIADHGNLIHKCDIDIPLPVLNHLYCLSGFNGRYREGTGFNDDIVHFLDLR